MYTQWNIIQPIKRNEILIHVIMQMNLKNIMLNERSQTQKATYDSTDDITRIGKPIKTKQIGG